MKKILKVIALVLCFILITESALAGVNETTRLSGVDRYKTAKVIAEEYNSGLVNSVVLAPGSNFANALPASVLAHKNQAPLLLVGPTPTDTNEAFEYIVNHLTKIGKIYLVGDQNLMGKDFETHLNQLGYKNIICIKGCDKYETDYLIAKELSIPKGNPVVISSGENFPDALAISSFAAANGWPILLTEKNKLTASIKEFIQEKQPAKIYITGGTAVICSELEEEIQQLARDSVIHRFGGSDRFATAIQIAQEFAPGPLHIYVASGLNFPDALAGSVLAAKNNGPIILVNPMAKDITPDVRGYLQKIKNLKSQISMTFIGGRTVIPPELEFIVSQEGGYITDPLRMLEENVVVLVNQERISKGLPALQTNDVLSKLARLKSQDMIDKDYFDHQSPTYGLPSAMIDSFGISYSLVGENIAYGQTTAQMVMDAWMNSPSHRENILKEEYQEIGVGLAKDSSGTLYWTQMFIRT